MKKILKMLLIALILSLPITAQATDMISLSINETSVPFSNEMGFPYISDENRTMVPIRVISENMNYNVNWDNNTKTVGIYNDKNSISFQIGSSRAIVNGVEVVMDMQNGIIANTKAVINNNRTYVPIRFITESMGGEIEYEKQSNMHKINIRNNGQLTIVPTPAPKPEFKPEPAIKGKSYTFPEMKTVKMVFDGEVLIVENYGSNDKIIVEYGGKQHIYSLLRPTERIALLDGSGSYNIKVAKHKEGQTYFVKDKTTKNIQLIDSYNPYLVSAQPVYWGDMEVKLSNQITAGAKNDDEKIRLIHAHVIKHIKYDWDLAGKTDSLLSYYPENQRTLSTGKGICYDYAALVAGLARAQGIPTKLVKGYREGEAIYHAWNEVLINGEWKSVDATWDSELPNPNVYTPNNLFNVTAIG